ncbi:DNA-binding protein [Rhizodiscina lignyota]|uniref:DNA-binding protein n=1 Tax=Rhizodiscina lignyota TaxID=1504668 RepID=A0A9P4MB01_9PEZI|nr:DNA-binding protein [Rhizodiscina lignyota]
MQATKVRPKTATTAATAASTSNAQEVTLLQSTEVVQTLLHSSISCLSYLRDLFPDNCFDEIHYGMVHPISYRDFAEAKHNMRTEDIENGSQSSHQSRRGTRTRLQILRRGKHAGAEQLLDWLEEGVFEALQKQRLRALQMNIFTDKSRPTNVLESYTFSFTYAEAALSGMTFKSSQGEAVTVKHVKHALHDFMRQMSVLCGTLPVLPDRRFLSLNLFYTDNCPSDYQPPFFTESTEHTLKFPEGDGWRLQTVTPGSMNSGHHATSLIISFLSQDNKGQTPSAGAEKDQIPADLTYSLEKLAASDINREFSSNPHSNGVRPSAAQEANYRAATPVDIPPEQLFTESTPTPGAKDTGRRGIKKDEQSKSANEISDFEDVSAFIDRGEDSNEDGTTLLPPPPDAARSTENIIVENSQVSTQTRQDVQTQKQLRDMLNSVGKDNSLEETQVVAAETTESQHDVSLFGAMTQIRFSQAKVAELDVLRKRLTIGDQPLEGISSSIMDVEQEYPVKCQCGFNEDDGDMICCDFCNNWQHACCYGYLSPKDPRIPDTHACYECLLGTKEGVLLKELQELALLRCAAYALKHDGGMNTAREFKDILHCDLQTANEVLKHFKQKDFLKETPGSRSRGFAQSGKPKWTFVSSGSDYERMMREYFDPSLKIAHHLALAQLPTQAGPVSKQVPTEQAGSRLDSTSNDIQGDPLPLPLSLRSRSRQQQSIANPPTLPPPAVTRRSTHSTITTTRMPKGKSAPLEVSQPTTPGKAGKRARSDEQISARTPKNSRKRLKMSKVVGAVDVSYLSPSQASTQNEL